jgi:hypothetical protein
VYVREPHADNDRDTAQVRRLVRRPGYALVWPPDASLIPLADVARELDADAVIVPAAYTHLRHPC